MTELRLLVRELSLVAASRYVNVLCFYSQWIAGGKLSYCSSVALAIASKSVKICVAFMMSAHYLLNIGGISACTDPMCISSGGFWAACDEFFLSELWKQLKHAL